MIEGVEVRDNDGFIVGEKDNSVEGDIVLTIDVGIFVLMLDGDIVDMYKGSDDEMT